MNAAPTTALALALALALGCRAAPPVAPVTAPPPAPVAPAAVPGEPAAVTGAAAAEPTPAEVQGLLDAWLRAQNTGDLAAYERLYAPRFTGVRRSGPRERRFDRAGWMADRQAMFRAAMVVAAQDVAVRAGPGVATVRFTQDFTQERFHDSGPKEMVIVRAGGALAIAREEMLASRLGGPGTTPAAPPVGSLLHVLSHGGARWVVLAPAPDDGSWSRGLPALVDRGEQTVVARAEPSGAVPQALRELRGQPVRAWHADGTACEARLGELAVLARVDVHFGTEQRWNGEGDDGARGPRASDDVVAREAWAEADEGRVLVARLDDAAGCATPPRWARLASQPPAVAFAPSTPDAALAGRVLARARELPAWRRLQGEYRTEGNAGAHWDSHEVNHAPVITLWQGAGGARRFVTLRASTMVGGCGQFSARATVVFELGGPQGLILHSDGAEPGDFVPEAAADLDGDGVPEFITAEGYARRTGAVFRAATPLRVPSHDCEC